MIDIQRALDQIKVVYQQLALDFITSNPIVPYTNPGLGQVHANVVVKGTQQLQAQGLVVGDWRYENGRLPTVSDASDADRQAGIAPLFKFEITIQLGLTEIPIEVNVFQ